MRCTWKCAAVCWSNPPRPGTLRRLRIRQQPTVSAPLAVGLLLIGNLIAGSLPAADVNVSPGSGALNQAIAAASPGDVLRLQAGVYAGPVTLDRPLTLTGSAASVIDGGGTGRVLIVDAPDAVVRGISVRNSGERLDLEDSGIFVTLNGDRALLEGNHLESNLIGINLKGPENVVVRGNVIIGSRDPRMNDRGNGVHLWNTPGSIVEGNTIQYGRDGIFVMASKANRFSNNRFADMRYAVHYMYTHDSEVSGNISTRNNSAYAVMYSDRVIVRDNWSDSDRERGLFLNAANSSEFHDNVVNGGAEKCVFIYNSNVNIFRNNVFKDCDIGVHFTGGSADNQISGNTFIANRTQVKYVGTRHLEWSVDGRGNYWSDNPAFDLDNDGVSDRPYRPNDLVDQLLWKHPLAKLLINTPAMQLLRWSQAEFPTLYPGGVIDSAPLMRAPVIAQLAD
jgi:nitrous oxidase accessory protein